MSVTNYDQTAAVISLALAAIQCGSIHGVMAYPPLDQRFVNFVGTFAMINK